MSAKLRFKSHSRGYQVRDGGSGDLIAKDAKEEESRERPAEGSEAYKRTERRAEDVPPYRKGEGNLARTVFYLAQSYRDSKQFEQALDWYEKRALMEGWVEETWHALYQLGRIQQALGHDWRVVLNSYLQAFNFRPCRMEPIYAIARFYREHQQWELGHHFARLVTEYGYPGDILFVERPVYEYLLAYEYAICCFHSGRVEEARRVTEILAGEGKIPADMLGQLKGLAGA